MRKVNPYLSFKKKLFLLVWDLLLLFSSIALVFYLRFDIFDLATLMVPGFWFIIALTLISLYIFGTYDLDSCYSKRIMALKVVGAIAVGLITVISMNYLLAKFRSGVFGRGVLIGSLTIFGVISLTLRILAVNFFNSVRGQLNWLMVVEESQLGFLKIDLARHGVLEQVTILTQERGAESAGRWDELETHLRKNWSGVVSGLSSEHLGAAVGQLLVKAKLSGCNVISLSHFYERHWFKIPVYALNTNWFISASDLNLVHHPIGLRLKRLADIGLSLILLSVAWPFILLSMMAIKLESPGPVLYRQVRTGKDGSLFTIFKLRSMRTDAEASGPQWAKKNDNRVTRVGHFIRKTRLDELPQLFNVLNGDMSFVGPRPERPEFNSMLEEQIPYYGLRHLVRPGITGWAQVCYPYGASVDDAREKVQYDLYYIMYFSFFLDFLIILRTVRVVLFGKGR